MRTWHVISIIVENKPQAHQKVHLHPIKVYNTRPVSLCWWRFFFRPLKCSLVPKLSTLSSESYNKTLSSDRIRGPTRSGKALSRIYKSFLSLLRKTCVASVTQRFLFPVFTVSARNAWNSNALLCHKYEEKRLASWVSVLTQVRLITRVCGVSLVTDKMLYPLVYQLATTD